MRTTLLPDWEAALSYLYRFKGKKTLHNNTHALLELFGSPQEMIPTFHIAGSKGKSTTASLLAQSWNIAGYRVGLFTSPHVTSLLERFHVLHDPVDQTLCLHFVRHIAQRLETQNFIQNHGPPRTFSLLFVLAFLLFQHKNCQLAVIEVGIGGRKDATNVIKQPLACFITHIEKEHTSLLGHSIRQIAKEKAGIVKPSVPVFLGLQHSNTAYQSIEEQAHHLSSPLWCVKDYLTTYTIKKHKDISVLTSHWRSLQGLRHVETPLRNSSRGGVENALLLIFFFLVLSGNLPPQQGKFLLREKTYTLPPSRSWISIVQQVLQTHQLVGRLEIYPQQRLIFDGAHTYFSVKSLLEYVKKQWPNQLYGVIFSVGKDKQLGPLMQLLSRHCTKIILTEHPLEKDPVTLCKAAQQLRKSSSIFLPRTPSLKQVFLISSNLKAFSKGLVWQKATSGVLIVGGSFYILEEAKRFFLEMRTTRKG